MAVNRDSIFFLGDDQATSQYSIIFPEGIPGSGDTQLVSARMNKEFTMPEESWYTYEVFDRGFKIVKKGMLQETDKSSMQIQIRIDQNWEVYDSIRAWAQLSYNNNTGEGGGDYVNRTTIIIQAENPQQQAVKQFRFKYVGVKSIALDAFNMESGDPMYMTVTFCWNEFVVEDVQ